MAELQAEIVFAINRLTRTILAVQPNRVSYGTIAEEVDASDARVRALLGDPKLAAEHDPL